MSWSFDIERYRVEVLEPSWSRELPPSFFRRYQLEEDADDRSIAAALDQVRRHLNQRALKAADKYKEVAKRLLDAHEQAGATLGDPNRRNAHRRELKTAREVDQRRLDEVLGDLSEAGRFLPAARFNQLKAMFFSLGEDQVGRQVEEHRLIVRDPRRLPSHPGLTTHQVLAAHLRTLGHEHILAFLFDDAVLRRGFRLLDRFEALADPRLSLDQARLDDRERAWATRARDNRTAAAHAVIGLLRQALRSNRHDGLHRLALYEFASMARLRRGQGFPQPTLARQVQELGLVAGEAAELAYAVSEEQADGDTTKAELRAALEGKYLRHAARLMGTLPAHLPASDMKELGKQVHGAVAEVERLRGEGKRLLAAGDVEAAAAALRAAAQRVVDDPSLDDELRRCPPAPPPSAAATTSGGAVVVAWEPSSSTAGTISYRVVRTRGRRPVTPEDGDIVCDTERAPVVDSRAPAGTELHYGVFTLRDGNVASTAPACTNVVVVAAEVDGLILIGGDCVIEGSWRLPTPAVGTRIVWSASGPPGDMEDGQALSESGTGFFRHEGLQPDLTYHYRVAAVYLTASGREALSEGIVAAATPQLTPEPVTDLTAGFEERHARVILRWVPPPAGEVRIYVAATPPRMASGAVVAARELETLGALAAAVARRRGDGRMQLVTSPTAPRAYYTAVTVCGARAIIGATCALIALAPVSDLKAQPFLHEVRLLWIWPPDCPQVVVAWREGSAPTDVSDSNSSTLTVSFQEYRTGGGVRLPLSEHAYGIAVFAAGLVEGAIHYARPATLEGIRPLGGTEVSYDLAQRRLRGQRRLAVRISVTDRETRLPEFILVAGRAAPPAGPDSGQVVLRVPAGTAPGEWHQLSEVPERGYRGYLRGFLVGPEAERFRLCPPPAARLRVGFR